MMNTEIRSEGSQPHEWERHENEITDLLVKQQKTLREVMEFMSTQHGFHATERQYKYRFGCLKNIDSDEWTLIADQVRRRAALGKKTAVFLHGQPVPQERVSRGIARSQRKSAVSRVAARTLDRRGKTKEANRITLRTPSPVHPSPSPHLMACLPHEDPQVMLPARMSENRVVMAAMEELSAGDTEMIISNDVDAIDMPEITPDLGSQHPYSPVLPGLELPRASRPAAGAINISYLYGPMRNLPFFELLSAICWPDSIMRDFERHGFDMPVSASALARSGLFVATRDLFFGASNLASSEPLSPNSFASFTNHLRLVIPERFTADLSQTFQRLMDPTLPVRTVLLWLFAAVAFLASNDFTLNEPMDAFVRSVVNEGHAELLLHFMSVPLPTVRALVNAVFASAIRTGSVQLLTAMLDRGIESNLKSYWLHAIARINNAALTRRVLSRVDAAELARNEGDMGRLQLLQVLLRQKELGLAQDLLNKESVSAARHRWHAALRNVAASNNIDEAQSLFELGDNAGFKLDSDGPHGDILELAMATKNVEMTKLFLEHGALVPMSIRGKPTLDWLRLHCRGIFNLLEPRLTLLTAGFLLDDALNAANLSFPALEAYLSSLTVGVSTPELEQTLEESIRGNHVTAAINLLRHGVDSNGPTLARRPLATALLAGERKTVFIELLLRYNADVGRLTVREITTTSALLKNFLMSGPDYATKMDALSIAVESGNIVSTSMLLASLPANVTDKPWQALTALQLAASRGHSEMIHFLISRGADINVPAHPDGGRTALQAALLNMGGSHEIAETLLRYGADVSAPAALYDGYTALEALSRRWGLSGWREVGPGVGGSRDGEQFFHKLLDAGAAVNRPRGEPSSVLHGVIERGWHKALGRCLEPQHKSIANHMCDWMILGVSDDDDGIIEPRTPTQLAASLGDLEAVKMLVAYGADVNEAPGVHGGHTALQAAALRKPGAGKMSLVHFLLDHGADINGDPAEECGVTALQAAATAGDLMLAELLISRGADVNAEASPEGGRTAIVCAIKHNRRDMVQLLMNAGAMGT